MFLLDDEGMSRFIRDGYALVHADFPAGFHEGIRRRTEEMFAAHGNVGNNMLPLVPELRQVFDHPSVRGALTSILGPGFAMHPHRYCHLNRPGSDGQDFHQDDYEGDEHVKRHRCRSAVTFYYPQDVTPDMGPSAILPGSQYYDDGEAAHALSELPICGAAGTVAIMHFDLWHRAMPNASDRQRYMLKFNFARFEEPSAPAGRTAAPAYRASASGAQNGAGHEALYRRLWRWNCGGWGETAASAADIESLIRALGAEDEPCRLDAAYALGAAGAAAVGPLSEALRGDEEVRRHAAFALSAVGAAAVPALVGAAADGDAEVRASAVYALCDIDPADWDRADVDAAIGALTQLLVNDSEWCRRHAAEALGVIGTRAVAAVPALARLLEDEFFWVRDNAARALARLGPCAESVVPSLVAALADENRYVRAHAAMALQRIGTGEATAAVLADLSTSRWCPMTTPQTPY